MSLPAKVDYWPTGEVRSRTLPFDARQYGSRDLRVSYDYDPNRSLAQMTDHRLDRRTGYGYDRADRQVRVDEGSFEVGEDQRRGKDTSLSYDENSNVTTRRSDGRFSADAYVGGKTAGFVYDRLDREVSMAVNPTAGAARRTQTAWWDSGARRERQTRRADSADDSVQRSFFFSDGRISRMDRKRSGAPAGSYTKQADYAYDPNGNRSTDERGMHAYNSRDQLVSWAKPDGGPRTTYALNGSGSITSQTSDATTTRFTYAADGERLKSSETDGFTTSYQYDPGGLGEIVGYHTEGEGYETTHVYDEFARQRRSDDGRGKAASFTHDGDTKTERGKTFDLSYVGSSEALSQEQQFEGTEVRSYDYDSQMGRLGMAREGDGQPGRYRAYSTDANGTVEGLEDQNGEMPAADRYSYDPYGAHTADQAGGGPPGGGQGNEPTGEDAQANPFRFEGHYYDTNVQTYDMRARPYLPQAGRFLTEDRYESAAGDLSLETDALTQDRYAFAAGNPVNNIEYDGHEPIGSFNPNGEQPIRGSDGECYGECDDGGGSSQPPAQMPSTSEDYTTEPALRGAVSPPPAAPDGGRDGLPTEPLSAKRRGKDPEQQRQAGNAAIPGNCFRPGECEAAGHAPRRYLDGDPSVALELLTVPFGGGGPKAATGCIRFCDDAIKGAAGALQRILGGGKSPAATNATRVGGGAATARTGLAAENSVSSGIGVVRNAGSGRVTIPGSGPGGYRVPDFDPRKTIAARGTVVETKDVSRLSSTNQLRDLEAYATSRGVPLEIFTNASAPSRGRLAQSITAGRVRLSPLPGG